MSTQLDRVDRARLRQEVQKELERQKRISSLVLWIIHLIFAVVTTAIIWGVGLTHPTIADAMKDAMGSKNNPLSLLLVFPTILAFLGVFLHGMAALIASGSLNRSMRERVLMAVLGRELLDGTVDWLDGAKEKRKRGAVRLSQEGELVFDDDQEAQEDEEVQAQVAQKGKM